MNDSKILVVGSLAFDVMFSIPQDFRQSIPLHNGEIKDYNATYIADRKNEYPGGTAGNIAAWLGFEAQSARIFSAWGHDLASKGYQNMLEAAGHDLKGSIGDFTAHCYNVSDPLHQQLVIWQPNHYEANQTQKLLDFYSISELESIKYAIFAAGTPESIGRHLKEFRSINQDAFVIFDPGQVSPFFTPEGFTECLEFSDLLIGNKVEAEHFERYTNNTWPKALIQVTTLGAQGVWYKEKPTAEKMFLEAPKIKTVVETTGAGDAFRAGLISGFSNGQSLKEALVLGSQLGAQSVQLPQPQPTAF